MSPAQRRSGPAVIERLIEHPQQFSFFQTLRLLERWLRHEGGLSKVQVRNSLSMSFPASEVESLLVFLRDGCEARPAPHVPGEGARLRPADLAQLELTPTFMGLLGMAGTLPAHYTEALAHREAYQKDTAPRAFLDIFSHRALMLFYAAWKKHRLALGFEGAPRQRFMPQVLALAGLGSRALHDRLQGEHGGVADETLAYYTGALQQRHLSAGQLQQVLQDYLGVPICIKQFQGRWYQLPDSARQHLGMGPQGYLGRSAMLGERVWQRDLRVQIRIGPLDHHHFCRFLPGGAGELALREWLTLIHGVSLEYEIRLLLRHDDVHGITLDGARSQRMGRLGWDSFVRTRPEVVDRDDVGYDIHAAA